MSNAKHTPGPWKTDGRTITNDGQTVVMGVDTDGETTRVCLVDSKAGRFTKGGRFIADEDCPVRDANARLIAAAPDLLAACQRLNEISSYMSWPSAWSDQFSKALEEIESAIAKATGIN